MVRKRKKRSDCNHILYQLRLVETGEVYIGLSRVLGAAVKRTLAERFRRHLSRATHENKGWTLHERLRAYPDPNSWEKTVLRVVRGRLQAFAAETELRKTLNPSLNTFM